MLNPAKIDNLSDAVEGVAPSGADEPRPVTHNSETDDERFRRSGPTTGAKIVLLLQSSSFPLKSASALALSLGMSEPYIRRVCRALVAEGVLGTETMPRPGHPTCATYFVIQA